MCDYLLLVQSRYYAGLASVKMEYTENLYETSFCYSKFCLKPH